MLSNVLLKLYGAGLSTGKKYKHIHFTLSAGNYSINDFDGKAKKSSFTRNNRLRSHLNRRFEVDHTRTLQISCLGQLLNCAWYTQQLSCKRCT